MSEMADETELSREDRLVGYFAAGHSVAEVASLFGVSARTVHRWTRSPLFGAKLAEARVQRLQPLIAAAEDAAPTALQTLIAVADDQSAPASARVRAATAIIDTRLRLGEHVHVMARLAVLEAVVDEIPSAPPPADGLTKIEDLKAALRARGRYAEETPNVDA